MCLRLPAEVLSVDGQRAVIRIGTARRTVSILPTPDVRPGDWGLVSGGMLVRVIDAARAHQIASAVAIATAAVSTTATGAQP